MGRERLRGGFSADGCIHKFVYDHNDLLIHRNAVFDLKGHFEDIAFRVHRIGRHTDSELDFALIGKRLVIKDNKVVPGTKAFHNIQLFKPDKFENASEIADHLREKRTVVLNLESTNKDVARRLIDFLSGVAYAGEGKIKKVAANTYIITPYSVDIMGDLIDELENSGLYL